MGPSGSFPQQQIPSNNMTNGQVNGVYGRLPQSQFPQQQMQQKVYWILNVQESFLKDLFYMEISYMSVWKTIIPRKLI